MENQRCGYLHVHRRCRSVQIYVCPGYLEAYKPQEHLEYARLDKMARTLFSIFAVLLAVDGVFSFPSYRSLAGLSARQLEEIIPQLTVRTLPSPPGPLEDTSAKLVNDPAHPFIAPGTNDIRGPCPGLNTLANHGVCSSQFLRDSSVG